LEHFLTPHQSQYFAWQLTRQAASDSVESLASALVGSQVDLNPHQVEAALFACRNPLSRGVILADEVGLEKTNLRKEGVRQALLVLAAQGKAFADLKRLSAGKKAVIFTESKRTQNYLLSLLAETPYGDNMFGDGGDA